MASYQLKLDSVSHGNLKSTNPNFSGPSYETTMSSIVARSKSISFLEEYEYLREEVLASKQRFAKGIFLDLDGMGNSISEDWIKGCKARDKELSQLLSSIIMSNDKLQFFISTKKLGDKNKKVYDLADLHYMPNSFTIHGIDENDDILDIYISENYPKRYGCLFVSLTKVACACRQAKDNDERLFKTLTDLAMSILEIAGIYKESNPDDKTWRKQEDETYSLLTGPLPTLVDKEIDTLFQHVLLDIRESNKPYVKEIQAALRATQRYVKSSFSDADYYLSLKTDPAYIPGFKYKEALLKSIVETDPLAGCPFDQEVGYESAYNVNEPKGYIAPWIETMHIPNSGKFDSRAIHRAIAAIQDRCCYIHNRLFAVNTKIKSDCTISHEEGQFFTLLITNPEFREARGWCNVLAYDWSHATDKLLQSFQEECLRIVFSDIIVEFWHEISSCEKSFKFKDGSRKTYKQSNGQPQGLLGSFDAFTFAHHIMMLMTMSLAGLEEHLGSEFYRVLGDDSIMTSIKYDPDNKAGESYVRICAWANCDVNRSKSTEILNQDKVALVDFAKVSILDGQYFSPIPSRIANRIGQHNQDYYAMAAALWQGSHGYKKPDWVNYLIDFYYKDETDNKLARLLVKSGSLQAFKKIGFDNFLPENELEELHVLRLTICYHVNKVRASLLGGLLTDGVKENLDSMSTSTDMKSLDALLPPDLYNVWDNIENVNHKFNIALEMNFTTEDTIREIMNCSPDQARVMSAGLSLTVEEVTEIDRLLSILKAVLLSPKDIWIFKDSILNLSIALKSLERLNYRSTYKKNTLDVIIFRRTIDIYKELFSLVEDKFGLDPTEKELSGV